jgi:hypothetical protein
MTIEIIEYFGTTAGITGQIDIEPYEYEYIGNFKEIERVLKHFEENGFEQSIVSEPYFNEDGEQIGFESVSRDPLPGDKRGQLKAELNKVEAPDRQRIQIR